MINSDSLEQSQDVSAFSAPLNVEACSLIIPNSFAYSNEIRKERSEDENSSSAPLSAEIDIIINSDDERKEESSEDANAASALLITGTDSMINYDSFEQSQDANE